MSKKQKPRLPRVVAEWGRGEMHFRIVAVDPLTTHGKPTSIVEYADCDAMGEQVWKTANGMTHAPFDLLRRLLVDGDIRLERATK